jgi:hypothetical protein
MGYKLLHFCVIFQFLTMFYTIVRARAIGARAVSCYGSGFGSDQMMRLLAAPASVLQHCNKLFGQDDSMLQF